jgi:hypothetical protein
MSVMSMNSRMAMAEKLSVPQLQQAIQSGSLPAYIGIPLIEQKTREKSQMAAAQQGQQKPPSVASQVLQQADEQERGIDELPSNLPVAQDEEMGMAGGGIVAFADRGLVEDPLAYLSGMTPEALAADQARIDEIKANETPTQRKEREQRERDRQAMGSSLSNIVPAAKDIATLPGRAVAGAFESGVTRPLRAVGVPIPYLPESFYGGDRTSMTPFMDKLRKETAARATQTAPAIQKFPDEFPEESASINAGTQTPTQPGQRTPQPGINTLPSGARPSPSMGQPNMGAPSATQPESAMDRYARMLEAQGEDSAKARKDAKAMAILQAGLGIMGGTSPNALANIAQGALPATQAYQQELKGIRAEDRDRIKQLMELGVSKEKLALEAKKLGISEKRFEQMYEIEKQKLGVMGGSRADAAKNAEILRRDQLAFNYFKELLSKNPMATEAEQAVMQDRARVLAGRDSAQAPKDDFAGFSIVPRK